jgi:hypothetical protein
LDQSFLDPRTSEDGTPYAPKRFRELVRECWYISDNTHTSYVDVLDLSVAERNYLIKFIREKQEATREAIEAARAKSAAQKK